MRFEQQDDGNYRIYAGAIEERRGGYLAAVAVEQIRDVVFPPRRVYFDERLLNGRLFKDAPTALRYALEVGRRAVQLDRTDPSRHGAALPPRARS